MLSHRVSFLYDRRVHDQELALGQLNMFAGSNPAHAVMAWWGSG